MKIVRFDDLAYQPASHEDQRNPEVWKKVLLTREDLIKGRVQMVNWAKLPLGKKFKAHFHEDMEEVFIILSGKVRVKAGEEIAELEKGDAVVIPPQTEHEMENLVDHDVEYIVIGLTPFGKGRTVVV